MYLRSNALLGNFQSDESDKENWPKKDRLSRSIKSNEAGKLHGFIRKWLYNKTSIWLLKKLSKLRNGFQRSKAVHKLIHT